MLSLNQGEFYYNKIKSFKHLEKNNIYLNNNNNIPFKNSIKEGFINNIFNTNIVEGNTGNTDNVVSSTILNTEIENAIIGKTNNINDKILYNTIVSAKQKEDILEFEKISDAYNKSLKIYEENNKNDAIATIYNNYITNCIKGEVNSVIYAPLNEDKTNTVDNSDEEVRIQKDGYGNPKNYKYFIDKYLNQISGINEKIKKITCDSTDPDNKCDDDALLKKNIERNNSQKEYIKKKSEIDSLIKSRKEKIREIKKYNVHMFAWSVAGISLGGVIFYYFFKK